MKLDHHLLLKYEESKEEIQYLKWLLDESHQNVHDLLKRIQYLEKLTGEKPEEGLPVVPREYHGRRVPVDGEMDLLQVQRTGVNSEGLNFTGVNDTLRGITETVEEDEDAT